MKSVLSTRYSVLSVLLLYLAPCSMLQGAEYVQKQGAGELRLRDDNLRAPNHVFQVKDGMIEVRLSEKLFLMLSVEGQSPLKVEGGDQAAQVQALNKSGLWSKCQAVGAPQFTEGGKRWETTIRLDLLPSKESIIDLQLLPIDYTESGSTEVRHVKWQPIKVRVVTTVAALDPKTELRDITGVEDPPPPPESWTRWLPWAGIAAALLGLLAGAWSLRHRFIAPARPLPPHEWAVRELDRIEALRLPELAEVERYHTLLSDVVRVYLERRFNLPASQQTTAEFLDTMHRSPQLTAAQQHLLRDFLSRCDMAKFARAVPPPEECRAVGTMARSFVQETTPRPA